MDVLGSPPLVVLVVSVDVKQHLKKRKERRKQSYDVTGEVPFGSVLVGCYATLICWIFSFSGIVT